MDLLRFPLRIAAAGLELNPPVAKYIQGLSRSHEAGLLQTISHYEVLPESYIYGLADVRMAIKSTLPFLLPLLITVWAIVRRSHLLAKSGSSPSAGFTLDRSHERTHEYRHVPCAADVRLPHGTRSRRHNNTRAGKRGWPYVPVILVGFQIFNLAKSLPGIHPTPTNCGVTLHEPTSYSATLTPTGDSN